MTHVLKSQRVVNVWRGLNDECGGVVIELIGVCPNPTVISFFEDEGKRIAKSLMSS